VTLSDTVAAQIDGCTDDMIDVRRELHARPELSFEEVETTALIRDRLRTLGLHEEICPTPTGAVFSLEGGKQGGTVILRADIDGLPVQEATDLSFASQVDNHMHACGHDAHTAILLGVASVFAERAEDLPGRYLFVFQPAEEQLSGAQAMVDGGLLEGIDPVAVLGCHVLSFLPVGQVRSRPGLLMAGARGWRVTVGGSGGHAALQPRQGNVVLAVSRFADRLEGVVADLASEGTSCVCSPGLVVAGSARNVVPTRAVLEGTLRFFEQEQLLEATRRFDELAAEVAEAFDVEVDVEETSVTGPARNDARVTGRVLDVARRVLPGGQVLQLPSPLAASDDMSVLLDRIPGCYLKVGAGLPDGSSGAHHSPTFSVDERAMTVGARVLSAAAVELANGT
jgi:amidohydrolase